MPRPPRPRAGRFLLASLLAASLVVALLAAASPVAGAGGELPGLKVMTLYDGDGNIICQTGFGLGLGDEYLDEGNVLWRVDKITGPTTAVAVFVRRVDLSSAVQEFQLSLAGIPLAANGQSSQVGIYHTHNDESYVPSEGAESDPNGQGGVYRVGDAFSSGLEKSGLRVNHSLASHLPHDAGAYERSRRTATEVLRGSAAIFDVHRDAAPPEAYARKVDGKQVTQIMIVIGRENPQADSNLAFAEALKASADSSHPGLIRGILKTGGDFNQDLSSRALLLEVGAHTNRRQEAESGVTALAGVVPNVLGVGGAGQGVGAWRAVGIIAIIVVVGGGLWLYVATGGSWREAWRKLRSLGEEFAGYLGRRRRGGGPRRR